MRNATEFKSVLRITIVSLFWDIAFVLCLIYNHNYYNKQKVVTNSQCVGLLAVFSEMRSVARGNGLIGTKGIFVR